MALFSLTITHVILFFRSGRRRGSSLLLVTYYLPSSRPSFCRKVFGVRGRHLLLYGVGKMGWEGLYYTLLPPLRPRILEQKSILYKYSPQKGVFCATPA